MGGGKGDVVNFGRGVGSVGVCPSGVCEFSREEEEKEEERQTCNEVSTEMSFRLILQNNIYHVQGSF